jgi:hypothetical protein
MSVIIDSPHDAAAIINQVRGRKVKAVLEQVHPGTSPDRDITGGDNTTIAPERETLAKTAQ